MSPHPNPFPLTIPPTFVSTPTCSSTNNPSTTKTHPCPTFPSTPPFSLPTSPGCDHPSFQLTCSTPHSFITINNLSFSILSFNSNSSLNLHSPPLKTKAPFQTTLAHQHQCKTSSAPDVRTQVSWNPTIP